MENSNAAKAQAEQLATEKDQFENQLKEVQATAKQLTEEKNEAERNLQVKEKAISDLTGKQELLMAQVREARADRSRLQEVRSGSLANDGRSVNTAA